MEVEDRCCRDVVSRSRTNPSQGRVEGEELDEDLVLTENQSTT